MLLGFKPQFVKKILDGSKIHTIRATPKRTPAVGERLHMYTGLRTKKCELITKENKLEGIQKIEIQLSRIGTPSIIIDGNKLSPEQYDFFSISDGFINMLDFSMFWLAGRERCYFTGIIIHWTDLKY